MNGKTIYDWTKESLLNMLAGQNEYNDGVYAIELIQGFGSSIVVSVRSEGNLPISIDMNGEKIETDMALFSLGEN